MYLKIIIYLFHLLFIFPYLLYLGIKLKKTELKQHGDIIIPFVIIAIGYQLYLLLQIIYYIYY
jgi:hypothetical protein